MMAWLRYTRMRFALVRQRVYTYPDMNIKLGRIYMNTRHKAFYLAVLFLGIFFLLMTGCGKFSSKPDLKTEYQAVFLDNGQVFFGKADFKGEYVSMKDIYYVQNAVNPNTKEVSSVLIRRGNEWHGPNEMYLNASHVVLIEPVGVDSRVAKLIQEDKAKNPPSK
jgi:hypothetical protein